MVSGPILPPRPLRELRRRGVGGGPGADRSRGARVERPREAEVRELRSADRVEEHVARLHVAVDDAGGVRVAQRVEQREEHGPELVPGRGRPGGQRPAGDELHREPGRARALAVRHHAAVEDPDDVRVVEARHRADLVLEQVLEQRVRGLVDREQLQRHREPGPDVDRAPDLAHRAAGARSRSSRTGRGAPLLDR